MTYPTTMDTVCNRTGSMEPAVGTPPAPSARYIAGSHVASDACGLTRRLRTEACGTVASRTHRPTIRTMMTLPVSEAKARLNELARLAHAEHERFTLTRNGRAEAVLMSVDDLEGLELTLEILADRESVSAIAASLAELDSGQAGVPLERVRADLRQRHTPGA